MASSRWATFPREGNCLGRDLSKGFCQINGIKKYVSGIDGSRAQLKDASDLSPSRIRAFTKLPVVVRTH